MLVHRGFRYRIYPTAEQDRRLRATEDAARFIWNLAHEQRLLARASTDKRYPTAFDQILELTGLRRELPWLQNVSRDVLANTLVSLDMCWQRCFRQITPRHGAPRWKKKGDAVSLRANKRRWRIHGNRIMFPNVGRMRVVFHRPLEGAPGACVVRRDGDQWFVSITCAIELPESSPKIDPAVAIDRGVVNAVADSDGAIIRSPQFFARAMKRLARAQRVVSRRKKGSKNREKAKNRVMRLHRKVRRQREHFVHELSARYAKSHGTVIVEDLRPALMMSVGGALGRSIADQGWGMLVRQIRYKIEERGGRVVEVSKKHSSQECSACGCVDKASRRTQSAFRCVGCGFECHADINAAMVLKSRASRSVQPAEGSVPEATRRSRKRLRVPRRAPQTTPRCHT